jgi:hypothetical protein
VNSFFAQFSAKKHAFAVFIIAVITSYYLVPDFKVFVDAIAALIPNTAGGRLLKSGIVAGVSLIMFYHQGRASGASGSGTSKAGSIAGSVMALLLCFSLTACSVSSTLVTVERSLPVAVKIATSVLAIVNGAPLSAAELADINSGVKVVSDNLSLAQSLLDQYNTTLKNNPNGDPGIVAEIDAAIGAVQANIGKLGSACIGCSDKQKTALQFAATTITGVVDEIISLLPAQHAAAAPHALSRTIAQGASVGSFQVPIKSARELAKQYNAGIAKSFPQAQVQVP